MERVKDVNRLYELLSRLEYVLEGKKGQDVFEGLEKDCKGICFYFCPDEKRNSDGQYRITRVEGFECPDDLKAHVGTGDPDIGDHRRSDLRSNVGEAIIQKNDLHNTYYNWGYGNKASEEVREKERELEKKVSEFISSLEVLWLPVEDEETRRYIEKNAIALLSNYGKMSVDKRKNSWLGYFNSNPEVSISGLWNSDHINEEYDPEFLDRFEDMISDL